MITKEYLRKYRNSKVKNGKCFFCKEDRFRNSSRCKYHIQYQKVQKLERSIKRLKIIISENSLKLRNIKRKANRWQQKALELRQTVAAREFEGL